MLGTPATAAGPAAVHAPLSDLLQPASPALGVIALVIGSAALLDASVRIARRLLPAPPLSVLGTGSALVAAWLLVMLSMVLLFLGLYRPWFTTAGALLIAVLA